MEEKRNLASSYCPVKKEGQFSCSPTRNKRRERPGTCLFKGGGGKKKKKETPQRLTGAINVLIAKKDRKRQRGFLRAPRKRGKREGVFDCAILKPWVGFDGQSLGRGGEEGPRRKRERERWRLGRRGRENKAVHFCGKWSFEEKVFVSNKEKKKKSSQRSYEIGRARPLGLFVAFRKKGNTWERNRR